MIARMVAGVLVAASLLVGGVAMSAGRGERLQEDEPGWDCRSMGNRVCGPVYIVRDDFGYTAYGRDGALLFVTEVVDVREGAGR